MLMMEDGATRLKLETAWMVPRIIRDMKGPGQMQLDVMCRGPKAPARCLESMTTSNTKSAGSCCKRKIIEIADFGFRSPSGSGSSFAGAVRKSVDQRSLQAVHGRDVDYS